MKHSDKTMDKVVALCKNRGFVYPGSEIYGGLANSWDYGPLGVEYKNNVKRAWLKKFVQECPYNVGLDSAILMNKQVWVASGHVATFNDPLIDCKACNVQEHGMDVNVEAMTGEELVAFIRDNKVPCPGCGKSDFTDIRKFNLMFKTHQGVTEDNSTEVYLRPETAQGIFVNFRNIQRTTRKKIPFGVAQIGKSFRNESFSASPAPIWNGSSIGGNIATSGSRALACRTSISACGTTKRRSSPSIPRPPQTLNISSPSAGVSFGVWPTARITT